MDIFDVVLIGIGVVAIDDGPPFSLLADGDADGRPVFACMTYRCILDGSLAASV